MATNATLTVEYDDATVYGTARVEGDATGPDGQPCAVEYNATTPLLNAGGQQKANAVILAQLLASLRAQRRATLRAQRQALSALNGTVDLS